MFLGHIQIDHCAQYSFAICVIAVFGRKQKIGGIIYLKTYV